MEVLRRSKKAEAHAIQWAKHLASENKFEHSNNKVSHTLEYIHAYVHTYIHTYIHTHANRHAHILAVKFFAVKISAYIFGGICISLQHSALKPCFRHYYNL